MNSRTDLVGVLVALIAMPASAQTINFVNEELLVVASASPDASFVGGVDNETLTIDQDSGDFGGPGVSHALLRFLDYSVPVGATVRSAALRFFSTSATDGPVEIYQLSTDWSLATTWNELGGDGLSPGVETLAGFAGSQIAIDEGLPVSFDVTDIVIDWANGAPKLGFGIINQSGNGWDIRTVDLIASNEFAPQLSVEFENPPPAHLQIDPNTGMGRLVSVTDEVALELRGYDLQSESGALQSATWETTNLSSRGLDTVDQSLLAGHWSVVNSAPDPLFEAFYLGGTTIDPRASLSIGKVIDPIATVAVAQLTGHATERGNSVGSRMIAMPGQSKQCSANPPSSSCPGSSGS